MIGKVFRVWPKRTRRLAGQVMVVTVVTKLYTPTPFYGAWEEVRTAFLTIYQVDIKRMGCVQADFNYEVLDK